MQSEGAGTGNIYLQISRLHENSTCLKRSFSSVSGCITGHGFELMKQVLLSSGVITSRAAAADLLPTLPGAVRTRRVQNRQMPVCTRVVRNLFYCRFVLLILSCVLSFSDVAPVLQAYLCLVPPHPIAIVTGGCLEPQHSKMVCLEAQ